MQLSADQQAAANAFIAFLLDDTKHEILLIGNAGTGKSFLTKYLVQLARNNAKLLTLLGSTDGDLNIEFTASTNKAAVVLSEKVGEPATTIHSLLGLKVLNDYKTGQTTLQKTGATQVFYNTLIIIDEASMIDSSLLKIIREQTMNCKLLYIGDSAQLAPIFETVSPVFVSVPDKLELTTIQRQQQNNPIITLSQQLRDSVFSDSFSEIMPNGIQIQHLQGEDFQSEINRTFTHNYTVNSAKILAWTNSKVLQYNEYVHQLIKGTPDITIGDILVTNNPILGTNGSTVHSTDSFVTVAAIQPSTEKGIDGNWITIKESRTKVFVANNLNEVTQLLKNLSKQKDWVKYFAAKDFFADLRNIYSSTVHKSQGSTYGTVFIDLSDIGSNNKSNEVARLLYVAITRASERVVFYGKLPSKYTGGSSTFSI